MSHILDKYVAIIWLRQKLLRTSSPRVTFLKKKKLFNLRGFWPTSSQLSWISYSTNL